MQGELDPQSTAHAVEALSRAFGKVEVDEAVFFFHTPHIITHEGNLDNMDGSAQHVPPCGDQTPAYLGKVNGPVFEEFTVPQSDELS